MSDTPEPAAKNRRWFVILAVVTLVGFAIFVGAITVLALRIPELKKSRYGLMEVGSSERPA
jgi:uncharacterized membrane protein YgdD (TMEM256/DUF423 family)